MLKSIVGRLFGRSKPSYEDARARLEQHSATLSLELAGEEGAPPEVLYYLATDGDAAVRRRVAGNIGTPVQADRLLCDDEDEDVRSALARKVNRLLPHLDAGAQSRTRTLVLEMLTRLAADQAVRVRAVLAEAIKESSSVPPALVKKLARDAEASVALPILEFSPLLSDVDLREIVTLTRLSDRLQAVAKRRQLSPSIATAVVETMDVPAIAALLENLEAAIPDAVMDQLLDKAVGAKTLHGPLVSRTNLSTRVMRRIAGFVSTALVERLAARHDLPADLAAELKATLKARVDGGVEAEKAGERNVQDAVAHGAFDDHFVAGAAESMDRETVIRALAKSAQVTPAAVKRILDARNARVVTALVWKAGLSMRVSLAIQQSLLKLPTRDVLPARGGTDFPISSDEMTMHLELFGLKG